MSSKPDISIIGTGALGTPLIKALDRCGYYVRGIYNRSASKAEELAGQLNAAVSGAFPGSGDPVSELIFIAVPDDSIGKTTSKLASRFGDLSETHVIHCSGNLTSDVLADARKAGAGTAAFHPLQTFHEQSDPGAFRDIYISLEGGSSTVKLLKKVVMDLGAEPMEIAPASKPFLHAAAVMASNYLYVLLDAAEEIAELGEMEPSEARKAVLPLVNSTIENAKSGHLYEVLSGPIARGDVTTVSKHLELLEHKPALLSLYKMLGARAIEMARNKEISGREKLDRLEELLRF